MLKEINKIFFLEEHSDYAIPSTNILQGNYKELSNLLEEILYLREKKYIKEKWKNYNLLWLEKYGRKNLKINPDYFDFLFVPAFSDKAIDNLKELLENGELLNLYITSSDNQTSHYNLFSNFNIFDCLDIKNSELKLHSNGLIERFIKPIFFIDKIKSHIFRIPQSNLTTFVTNVFVEKVLENKLVGFYFIPLYSIDGILGEPITTDYKKRRKKL